jgi:Cd2+/Zn2+-exporting ATPase
MRAAGAAFACADDRRGTALRLVAAILAAGLLAVAWITRLADPAQAQVAGLLDAAAAALAGAPVLLAAWRGLAAERLEAVTDVLVSAALIAAWAGGDLASAALVPMLMVLGHIIEERSLAGGREAVEALARLTGADGRCWRLRSAGGDEEVAVADLAIGDRIVVRPGERVPADAVVEGEAGSLDLAPLSGESVPVEVQPGDEAPAGAVNAGGLLRLRVQRLGGDTGLGRVLALLDDAARCKPAVARVLDRYAGFYLPLVLLAALAVLATTGALGNALAVLVVCCPCALALAAPASALAAVAVAARHGALVAGGAALERLAACDRLAVDKTGTLTRGELAIAGVRSALPEAEIRRLAGSLGAVSTHPVSRALAGGLESDERIELGDAREERGRGVTATADGACLRLGSAAWLAECGVAVPPAPEHDGPLVALARERTFLAWILLDDRLRPEAAAALARLRDLGLAPQCLVSGDRPAVARRIGDAVGIDMVHAGQLPDGKLALVRQLGRDGRVLVVGDGINDALMLRAGTVGVALAGDSRACDLALRSADIVLRRPDLRALPELVLLARRLRSSIAVGVGLALGWTGLLVVAAAAGWMPPLAAALLHTVGSVLVLGNAARLMRQPVPDHPEDPSCPATPSPSSSSSPSLSAPAMTTTRDRPSTAAPTSG